MKVFTSGGASFVDSHFTEHSLDRGDQILILDDLSTGAMGNIEPLTGRPYFDYRIGSAEEPPLVPALVDRRTS